MKELWLEFGFVHTTQNNFHDVCWYNEGRASELMYFLKEFWNHRKKKNMYFLWRYGKKNHYLRKV